MVELYAEIALFVCDRASLKYFYIVTGYTAVVMHPINVYEKYTLMAPNP